LENVRFMMTHEQQPTLISNFPDPVLRQELSRDELVNQIPASKKAKAFIKWLSLQKSAFDEEGSQIVRASNRAASQHFDVVVETIRNYRRAAVESGFLRVLDDKGGDECGVVYLIPWHSKKGSILNREPIPRDANSTVDGDRDATSTDRRDLDGPESWDATSTTDSMIGDSGPGGQIFDQGGSIGPGEKFDPSPLKEFEPPPSNFEGSNSPSTPPPLKTLNVLNTSEERLTLEELGNDCESLEGSKFEGGVDSLFPPSNSRRDTEELPFGTWKAWKLAIRQRRLSNPKDVDELYKVAVSLRIVSASEVSRRNIHSQAACQCRLNASGKSTTQAGLFASNVAFGRWFCSIDDEAKAEKSIEFIDKPTAVQTETTKQNAGHEAGCNCWWCIRDVNEHLRRQKEREEVEEKIRHAQAAEKLEALEKEFGPLLDSLSVDELMDLAADNQFLTTQIRRSEGIPPVARFTLIELLASRAAISPGG
jgi:hypothetical protein